MFYYLVGEVAWPHQLCKYHEIIETRHVVSQQRNSKEETTNKGNIEDIQHFDLVLVGIWLFIKILFDTKLHTGRGWFYQPASALQWVYLPLYGRSIVQVATPKRGDKTGSWLYKGTIYSCWQWKCKTMCIEPNWIILLGGSVAQDWTVEREMNTCLWIISDSPHIKLPTYLLPFSGLFVHEGCMILTFSSEWN